VEKLPPTGQTYVLINEVPRDHWGNAGTIYSPT
jgi:phenylpyruvate tautomerase PptA (4-oxalocrotonate tautomerase family)